MYVWYGCVTICLLELARSTPEETEFRCGAYGWWVIILLLDMWAYEINFARSKIPQTQTIIFLSQTIVLAIHKIDHDGVPMARHWHRPILSENEATPSRKLFKHLSDLKTAISIKQITKKSLSTAPADVM